jgi:ATP-dependent Clp protease protease subunit
MPPHFLTSDKEKDKKDEVTPSWDKNLFDSRSILIFGEINMELAQKVCAQLLALSLKSKDPIKVFINSPGGHVESGDTIHDMLGFIDCPVKIIGTGWVASAGALIYLGAKKENRFSLANTRFLLHQPHGGMRGTASDIKIQAEEIIKMRERINRIIAKETGTPYEKVAKDTERDYWLSPEEAKTYGIVHKIINHITELDMG